MKRPEEEKVMVEGKETPKKTSKKLQPAGRSIDTYAAQCEKCFKWRVIDTQEEYEEIRSNVQDRPFFCQTKPGVTCKDPADIDYDATRTWVIDKPGIPRTPEGFKRSLILRKDFSKMDAYYITPTGKKLRTRGEILSFIEANPKYKDVSLEHFNFTVPKVMDDTVPPNFQKKGTSRSGNKKHKTLKDV
ncbi:methyl-CpG-binding domain-containing protein 4-like [Carica papaya]|uniref:methyl-CpG-binding domain-containing protein 4-like n=1 Tax=Carica papaya TaxID=3649 RepID=UPI000B8CD08E|nr:methyl-CpG-binding domain-containing protein 4-like [Carica papaya]